MLQLDVTNWQRQLFLSIIRLFTDGPFNKNLLQPRENCQEALNVTIGKALSVCIYNSVFKCLPRLGGLVLNRVPGTRIYIYIYMSAKINTDLADKGAAASMRPKKVTAAHG